MARTRVMSLCRGVPGIEVAGSCALAELDVRFVNRSTSDVEGLEPAMGDDACAVADEPLPVVGVLAEGFAEVVAARIGEKGGVHVERHVVDDPPPALGPALGLEPLVDAHV